jgi:tripartite-type tricarboxylate transporter receptor subunit TctC
MLMVSAVIAGFAGTLHAQTFPTKPLRIIVPFPPGGASDATSRIIGEQIAKPLAQPVIVENRPGAGATIGYDLGAKAAPDGHTITIVFPSFVVNPSVRKVNYDPLKDFRPVTQALETPMVYAVHPTVPAKTFKELIALARARPGDLGYGTPGIATSHHVLTELIAQTLKVKFTHVPYAGSGPAIIALVGGHIPMMAGNVLEVAPHVATGKIRAIVVSTAGRAEQLPNVPTFREVGHPELEAPNWAGFVVPAATPAAAVARLNSEIVRALRLPEVQEKLRAQGITPVPTTPEQFAKLLQAESVRYAKVVREANIRAE